MDVRCERCKTEYEFEDARITEAGVTVKCTTCGHVFRVKKKALVVTVPVKPGATEASKAAPVPAPSAPAAPTPAPEKPREWKVRQANGNVFTFKELTTLQKWIVERKVARDDEISLTGETWKRLGNIAELASFFQVVDEAQKAAQLQALQAQGLLTSSPASPPAPVPAAPIAAAPTPPPPEPPNAQPPSAPVPAPPRTATPEPRFVQDRMAVRTAARHDEGDDDFEAAGLKRSGGAGKWIAALLLLGALGAGGYYGYFHYWLPLQQAKSAPPPVVVAPPAEETEQTAAPATDAGTESESAAAATSDAGTPEEVAAAPVAAEPTPAPAPEVVPAAAVAPTPKKEPVRDFDGWVTLGDRLRMRERAEQAIEAYDKAIALKPTRAEPIAGRGLALLDLGDRSAAEQAFREALQLNPRYAVAIMGLAETLRQTNRNAEAVEQYQRYLEILPNGPEAPVAKAAIERLKE